MQAGHRVEATAKLYLVWNPSRERWQIDPICFDGTPLDLADWVLEEGALAEATDTCPGRHNPEHDDGECVAEAQRAFRHRIPILEELIFDALQGDN